MNSINSIKRKLLAASIVVLSLMIFTEYSWASTLLPWVRFGGTYQTTAGIGAGSLTLNAFVKEMDYENGDVLRANVPGVETIYGARVVLSGATRTGNYSFNGDPANPDDVTFSIVALDGYVYFTSNLADTAFTQQGTNFVWLNQYLNANDPATLNLHNIILHPNGDDGLHPSRYINELAAYLGATNVSGLKMQLFVPSSGNFTTNSSGTISYGLIDGLQSLKPPTGLNATAISSSQINLSWADNSNNETGFKIERKTGAGGTYSQIAIVGANVTTYSDTGLTAVTTYYYKVRAYNSFGDSNYSNETSFTTSATWTGGGADNLASNPANWSGNVVPQSGDNVVFDGTNNCIWDINVTPASINLNSGFTGMVTLNSDLTITGGLTIDGGILNLNNKALNANSYILIGVGGNLYAASSTITVKGNWLNYGIFIPGTSTVILNGTNQTIYGNTTFYNLTKTVASADTLYFQAGSAQTILNTLTLQGASSGLLALRSAQNGSYWYINPQGTRNISYVDIKDMNNLNVVNIVTTNSQDSGNNNNVSFGGSECACLKDSPLSRGGRGV